MKPVVQIVFLGFSALFSELSTVAASPFSKHLTFKRSTPTVYLCGDSTMAAAGANNGKTDGWGQYLGNHTTIPVINKAIAGRSARSYWDEGRFSDVADAVTSGDIVVIEFGHNDGGSPESGDNGRSDCPGEDLTTTCTSDADGSTVHTFVHYVTEATKLMLAKGASVVLSAQTPNNPWETGTFVDDPPRFVAYQKTAATGFAADSANGAAVSFVDHFQAADTVYAQKTADEVDAMFPSDHTHTSPAGAQLVAEAFASAVASKLNGTTALLPYVKASS